MIGPLGPFTETAGRPLVGRLRSYLTQCFTVDFGALDRM